MNHILQDILRHVGVGLMDGAPGRGSGRYPLGSGKTPYQRPTDFLSRVEGLKAGGHSEREIANMLGITTSQLRAHKAIAKNEQRSAQVARAKELREQGLSLKQIATEMGFNNDSSVRSLLNEDVDARKNAAMKTAELLKKHVDEKGMIDVGAGVAMELGVSNEKLREALTILEEEGYPVYGGGIPQVTNVGKQTNRKVLCAPGTEHKEIYDLDKVHYITDYTSHDGGETFDKLAYPASMDSKRLKIRYAEDGGVERDGLIEIRRGVQDLSLGESHYAQVRILVDHDRFLKGMAVYSDDLPDGVDVLFNTNKPKGTAMRDTLKKIKEDDPTNPFGSLIKATGQSYYTDENGERRLSLINKRAEEGDWGEWSKKLPSQFLSKQSMDLIRKQLGLETADKKAELDEILSLTNPTIKKHFLQSFAEDCDSAAVHLQAAALPRQKYQVILPVPSLKDNEVYAPNYENGEKVALIRYPHGGTFEIPILTVNNKHADSKKMIGNAPKDAVGINSKVAERLSGADFDGDTVMVIPTGRGVKITSTPPLKGLENFDPKLEYGGKKEGTFRQMKNTQTEMGKISNLITDMTLKGAPDDEIARAVRHSMVVIDAEKHKLDYKQSELDNGIKELRRTYQDGKQGGASTLISRAKSETSIPKTKGSPIIDPDTGEVSYKLANETYVDKKGKTQTRMQKSTRMADTKDARSLISTLNTPQEQEYADFANSMKAMANTARKELVSTGNLQYSASARKAYDAEYKSLDASLKLAEMNAPRERKAQALANSRVKAMKASNPDMSKEDIKKASQRALVSARAEVGAKRHPISVSDKEWEAIQAGAISENQLRRILRYADADDLRQKAMPRATTQLSSAKIAKINSMKASGYSTAEIAKSLGVSTSTVQKYL